MPNRNKSYYTFIQVSQVTSGPRRGPTFNNRWWNDQRSWNLRTTNWREKASPKGANHIQSCYCSPPSGTVRECVSYPQVPFPSVIPPAVIHIRPLRGRQDATCETSVIYILRLRSFLDSASYPKYLQYAPHPKIHHNNKPT